MTLGLIDREGPGDPLDPRMRQQQSLCVFRGDWLLRQRPGEGNGNQDFEVWIEMADRYGRQFQPSPLRAGRRSDRRRDESRPPRRPPRCSSSRAIRHAQVGNSRQRSWGTDATGTVRTSAAARSDSIFLSTTVDFLEKLPPFGSLRMKLDERLAPGLACHGLNDFAPRTVTFDSFAKSCRSARYGPRQTP